MIKFIQAQKGKVDKKFKGWAEKLAKINDEVK
jgi:hypothetical protein